MTHESNRDTKARAGMDLAGRVRRTAQGIGLLVGRRPATPVPHDAPRGPDWAQASPVWIEAALALALAKNGGGWYALDRREAFHGAGPWRRLVRGLELVIWRGADGELVAGPDACPHLGAALSGGRVEEGRLVCPWHGLKLDQRGFRGWHCHPVHDDGVLVWVRLPTPNEEPTEQPILAPRPHVGVAGTIVAEARCEPEDVLANRLDPWHGAHLHPHSFAALAVLEQTLERLLLRVTYKIAGPIGIEVDATFHCPDPRTIVMTIVDGDGVGSVVETHATPIAPGRTLLIESTIATSDRIGFAVVRRLPGLVRPFIEARARRLWSDDLVYAERRHALRVAAGHAADGIR